MGSGKSLIAAEFIRRVHEQSPRARIVLVTHVKELLEQNAKELLEQYPRADVGFYCAGLGEKKLYNDITFASIQSVYDKADSFNRAPDIVIVDEAHLIPSTEDTQYRRFFSDLQKLNPNVAIVGMTGTPFRADSGRLDEGDNALFGGIAYQIDMKWMIEEGYWSRPVIPSVSTKLNVEGVRIVKGDYAQGALEKAVDVADTTKACVREMVEIASERRKWLIFAAGINHAGHIRDELIAQGVIADMVTGKTPKAERDEIIKAFARGDLRALVNVAVLTTGFNVPDIDMLAFCRPTRSPVLYIQCIGRGTRPVYAQGYDLSTRDGRLAAIESGPKKDCMIMDFGKVIETLGPIDALDIRKASSSKKDKDQPNDAVTKICPACAAQVYAAVRQCACGYVFPINEIETTSEKRANILSEPEVYDVYGVTHHVHTKRDNPEAPQTMRVSYYTSGGYVSEYVCFDHPMGYARQKASQWAAKRILGYDPASVAEAVDAPWPKPLTITVKQDGKYKRIIKHDFGEGFQPQPFPEPVKEPEPIDWGDNVIPFKPMVSKPVEISLDDDEDSIPF